MWVWKQPWQNGVSRQQAVARSVIRRTVVVRLVLVGLLLIVVGVLAEDLAARTFWPEAVATPEQPEPLLAAAQPDGDIPSIATDAGTRPEFEVWSAPEPAEVVLAQATVRPPVAEQAPAHWVSSVRETGLWSGPEGGVLFSRIPAGVQLRAYEHSGGRLRVFFPGDRLARKPGEAWLDLADASPASWPRWARLRWPGSIVARPEPLAPLVTPLKAGEFVEVLGEARGEWARVHYLGDGRAAASEGWIQAQPAVTFVDAEQTPSFALSYDLLKGRAPEVWLKVPFRTQLDGSPYEDANCGPTVLNMVLERFGRDAPQGVVRREVLAMQPAENCDDCGVYIESLAAVAEQRGLKTLRLRDDDPQAFHHWTQEEIQSELRAGRPVVVQVYYRGLPGRASASYYGDHYVVLHGIIGDRFIFNDPVDVEGPGYSRLMTAAQLERAMANSDFPFAGFSVSRS